MNITYERLFSIKEFHNAMGGAILDDSVTLAKINHNNVSVLNDMVEDMFMTRSMENILCNIFVLKGEISATINYRNTRIQKHSIFSFIPLLTITEFVCSPDTEAYIFICSREFIMSSNFNSSPISISEIINREHSPITTFEGAAFKTINDCYSRIWHYLNDTGHLLRREIVRNSIYNFLMEFANILFSSTKIDKSTAAITKSSIKETYIKKFIELLVRYGEKEHNPAFYADKLCISVQYLSLILKEISGKTAGGWIARYVITRAKVMLRKPENSIQQVAESLNFSDQSSFGKFFKKHTGSSPKRYKEQHMVFF